MKDLKKISVTAFFSVLLLPDMTCMAQKSVAAEYSRQYPKGYFRNPLNIPMELTANFGELRPDHWHMGLDLRTNQKENYPVFAAAEGYVAHVGIRPLSFGRYLVINHPNGYSTLYAHLNSFFPALEQYVKTQQLKNETWAIELDMHEKQFPVRRSDTIARSGNTGGSQGPHLHFEIRETKTRKVLNPLLFGFNIKDNIPPVITRLAMYNRELSTYEQTPVMIPVKKTDSGFYTIPRKIMTGFRKISFSIGAYDRVNESSSPEGIYQSVFYLNDTPRTAFLLDKVDYNESAYVNSHIDYRFRFNGGAYLQHLSKLPGNGSAVYQHKNDDGVAELRDTSENRVRIKVMDSYNNFSDLFFPVQYSDSLARLVKWPERGRKFIPNRVNVFEENNFEAYLPEFCLYDTIPQLYFAENNFLPGALSALHRFGDPAYPLHQDITVKIKPTAPIPDSQKVLIIREWQGRRSVRKAQWQKGWLAASFGSFGNFQIFADMSPPQVNPPGKGADTLDLSPAKKIVFTPTDNFGIRSFRAKLNGKWLMMTNDKAVNYVYVFDEQCPYGVHELKLRIEDIAGNITEKTWWFKRYPYKPPAKKKASAKKRVTTKKPALKKK